MLDNYEQNKFKLSYFKAEMNQNMDKDDYHSYDEYFCIGFKLLKLIKVKILCQYFCSLPAITILIENLKVIPN